MKTSKYSKVLTVILIIVVIALVGLLGFWLYDCIQSYIVTKETSEFVDDFEEEISKENNEETEENNEDNNLANEDQNSSGRGQSNKRKTTSTTKTYKGFGVLGTMKIPATNFSYPVLDKATPKAIATAVAYQWGEGLNKAGNTVIVGHNYRNGLFFSKNERLKIGDKIYITDLTGTTLTYTIYNKFETDPMDTSFYQRDTGGVPEVSLSTCTDDNRARLIILARAE